MLKQDGRDFIMNTRKEDTNWIQVDLSIPSEINECFLYDCTRSFMNTEKYKSQAEMLGRNWKASGRLLAIFAEKDVLALIA